MTLKSFLKLMTATTFLGVPALASMVDTLPAGINSPSLRMGWISGIDQKYTSDGKLYKLSDINSMQFNAEALSRLSPRANILIETLDQFGTQQLGQNINYGVIGIDTKPQVQYTSPVYARGLTDKWTVGFATPIINYKNNISVTQTGSNLDKYQQFIGLDPELDAALNLDLVAEARSLLSSLGYKPIQSRNETYLGDIQLVSAYRFWEAPGKGLLWTATFNAPTGPQYDPDDLIALNTFGRTGIENRITYSQLITRDLEVAPYASYNYFFADNVTMRVPMSEGDILPDQNSKQAVRRKLGDTITVGGETYYNAGDRWSFGIGYSLAETQKDSYEGGGPGRYDVLEQDTESHFHRVNLQAQYSTVKAYMKKSALIPFIVTFNFLDTVKGKNTERRTLNELIFMMFF